MGNTNLIEPMPEECITHVDYKKIPASVLQKLEDQGQPMYLLCIKPMSIDILFSELRKQEYDRKQKLDFTQK